MKKSGQHSFKYVAGPLLVMFLFMLYINVGIITDMKDLSSDLGRDKMVIDLTGKSSLSGQQQQSPRIPKPRNKTYSILPSKVYSVIGLESSGTNFVTSLIRDALNQTEYREADFRYENAENEALDVQVQHFSLPQGSSCHESELNHTPILNVVLPSVCSELKVSDTLPTASSSNLNDATINASQQPNESECGQIAHDLWKLPPSNNTIKYPKRYLLDIVSHKEWYEKHGVEQYFIIVIRDKHISRKARSKVHCQDPKKLMMEEDIGTKIIVDTINKYILEDETYNKSVTKDKFKFWRSKFTDGDHTSAITRTRRRLQLLSSSFLTTDHASNGILNNNNVVVVSYESLMLLQRTYVFMLFDVLGIKVPSDFEPKFKDGNKKYLENNS